MFFLKFSFPFLSMESVIHNFRGVFPNFDFEDKTRFIYEMNDFSGSLMSIIIALATYSRINENYWMSSFISELRIEIYLINFDLWPHVRDVLMAAHNSTYFKICTRLILRSKNKWYGSRENRKPGLSVNCLFYVNLFPNARSNQIRPPSHLVHCT